MWVEPVVSACIAWRAPPQRRAGPRAAVRGGGSAGEAGARRGRALGPPTTFALVLTRLGSSRTDQCDALNRCQAALNQETVLRPSLLLGRSVSGRGEDTVARFGVSVGIGGIRVVGVSSVLRRLWVPPRRVFSRGLLGGSRAVRTKVVPCWRCWSSTASPSTPCSETR